MKDSTRKAKLAELLGMAPPPTATTPQQARLREDVSRAAESFLDFVEQPQRYRHPTCKACGNTFFVSRANVSYCSDECRADALLEIGIEWNWNKPPQDRWYVVQQGSKTTNEPFVVPVEAVRILKDFVDNILLVIDEEGDLSSSNRSEEDALPAVLNDVEIDELLLDYRQ